MAGRERGGAAAQGSSYIHVPVRSFEMMSRLISIMSGSESATRQVVKEKKMGSC